MHADSNPDPAVRADAPASGTVEWAPRHEARLRLCTFLARAAGDPRGGHFGSLLHEDVLEAAEGAAAMLAALPSVVPPSLAPGERSPTTLDLSPLVAALRSTRDSLAEEHARVFGSAASDPCPACETDYCQASPAFRSERLADLASCCSAFGFVAAPGMPLRLDHVASELECFAWLLARQRDAARSGRDASGLPADAALAEQPAAAWRDAQRRFLREHLAWWLPAFARALFRAADGSEAALAGSYLASLAHALSAWVPLERAALGVDAPTGSPAWEPAQARDDRGHRSCDLSSSP